MTFYGTALFMLLVFVRPQEWLTPWLYGWPLLNAVVFVSLLALLLEIDQGTISLPRRLPQMWLLVGLWFASMMSHVVHTYFAGMTAAMNDVFKICFFTLLLYCVLDSPRRLRTFARIFVVTACLMALNAILQERRGYGFAWSQPLWIPQIGERPAHLRTRFFGIFSDPNDLAQVLVAAMPLAFAMPRRMNVFSWLFSAGCAYFLFAAYQTTHSRGGTVALVTTAMVMITMWLPARWMPYLIGVGLVAFLGLCGTVGGAMLDAAARERVVFWGYGNQAFKQNPIFGIGYDMFWQIADGRPAHNAFVTCYTELGLFGYWMWFGLIILGVIGAWRVRVILKRPTSEEGFYMRRFTGLGLASMGGFAAGAYFLSRTFIYPFFFLMAVLNAVPRISEPYLPEDHAPVVEPRKDVMWYGTVLTLASVVYIYLSIVLLNKSYGGG